MNSIESDRDRIRRRLLRSDTIRKMIINYMNAECGQTAIVMDAKSLEDTLYDIIDGISCAKRDIEEKIDAILSAQGKARIAKNGEIK